MMIYYSSVLLLCALVLIVLCILVWENDRIHKNNKRNFYLTYALIAFAALMEWLSVLMYGNESIPKWLLIFVKTLDFISTPLAGAALISQTKIHNIWFKLLLGILGFNVVLQIVSAFNGWMIVVDDKNQYKHGVLYGVYIGIGLAALILVIIEFLIYGKRFRKQNRKSLYAIMILTAIGIAMQEVLELFGYEVRTTYLALTFGVAAMFIHYSEFSQINSDARIQEQQIQITTDALTGVQSRFAYSKVLKEYDSEGIPINLAMFLIDINGLKNVNDTLGHEAGDELICGAADCIKEIIDTTGNIYRIGGDEFVVLANMNKKQADIALAKLRHATKAWSGEKVKELSVSAGYALACDYRDYSSEQLAKVADEAMYEAKALYYEKSGIDRRRH